MKLNKYLKVCFMIVILLIFCFTPLGSVPIGPIVATTAMVPVIISSLTFGKRIGMIMGFMFGLFSFIYWTFIMPAFPTAFLFTPFAESASYKGNFGSIIICFLPRILIGLTPAIMSDVSNKSIMGDIFGSIVGSLTNTVLVIILIFVFFGNDNPVIAGKGILAVLSATVITNGIPEAIICAIVCPPVAKILRNI
ncbi:MAG: ECF transporter S component [Lachnospiraceae bacterium]|nr:ECF transporter S component [Lachnospiraceae bacterium]